MNGPIETAGPVKSFQKSFEVSQRQRSKSVKDRLNRYRDNLAMVLKTASEGRFIDYEDRLGGEQCADYGFGECSYWDGELRNRQLDDQELQQERDKKEDEYRTGRDELAM